MYFMWLSVIKEKCRYMYPDVNIYNDKLHIKHVCIFYICV